MLVRVKWLALSSVVLIGCFNPHDSLSPDGGLPRDGDGDGDGVADGNDNCVARANPAQDDEDKDGRGDACDRCPIRASEPDAPCDSALRDGSEVWAFESFHKDPKWATETAAWSWEGDRYHVTTDDVGTAATIALTTLDARTFNDYTVTTQVVVDRQVVAGEFQLGIMVPLPGGSSDRFLACQFDYFNNTSYFLINDVNPGPGNKADSVAFTWTPGTTYRFEMTVRPSGPDNHTCSLYDASGTRVAGPVKLTLTEFATQPQPIRLMAQRAEAHFDWVLVTGVP